MEDDGKIQVLEQQAAQGLRDLELNDEQITAALGPEALRCISG
jgi:hypothetical protein